MCVVDSGGKTAELDPTVGTVPATDVLQPVDANTGGEQMEGHSEAEDPPPAEVPREELKRCADIKFSGEKGAVVASGGDAVTSAPTYGFARDAVSIINDLEKARPDLFDRHAKHRSCGLLCKLGAAGMLIGDVLGLPLVLWELAEPIGKMASKHKDAISEKQKQAKRKAKRRGTDPEAAAAAVLHRCVTLPLPSADEIKAQTQRLAKAARLPEPPPAPEAPLAPEPPPAAPEPEPARLPDLTPQDRANIDMAMSDEAHPVIVAAYMLVWRSQSSHLAPEDDEQLQLLQVRFRHALRRLEAAHPQEYSCEYCRWGEDSAHDIIAWIVAIHSTGHPIPAAVAAAQRMRFDLDRAAADFSAAHKAAHGGNGGQPGD